MESDIWCAALCSVVFMASGMYIISLCKHKSKGGEEALRSYKGVEGWEYKNECLRPLAMTPKTRTYIG